MSLNIVNKTMTVTRTKNCRGDIFLETFEFKPHTMGKMYKHIISQEGFRSVCHYAIVIICTKANIPH